MTQKTTTPAGSAPPTPPHRTVRTRLEKVPTSRPLTSVAVRVAAKARSADRVVAEAFQPLALPALRVLLGLLFVWFGGLKVIGRSPVEDLVALTLPFADRHLVILTLGIAELVLGVLLMSGAFVRIALPVLAAHLVGTFAAFVMVPSLMFTGRDPLLLTTVGEFVVKNVVLIAATMVLIAHSSQTAKHRHPGRVTQV